MCRLFGLIANKKVNIEFSFLEADLPFEILSKKNPHGWGIGYYENDIAKIQKQPIPAIKSQKFQQLSKNLNSDLFISHVRYATQGEKTLENTHPFKYKNWIFAHNGNIDIRAELLKELNSKFRNIIGGETDSEVFFYWLLQNIEDQNDIFKGIKKSISFIQSNKGNRTSSLNFILTNNEKLIALRKAFLRIAYYSLLYLNRNPNDIESIKYQSEETKQLLISKNLSGEKAFLVCSEQLTKEEDWKELSNNQLIIVNKTLELKKWDI